MAEFFELFVIFKYKPDLKQWEDKLGLTISDSIYCGRLDFFKNKKLMLNEYNGNNFWEYEFSVSAGGLFLRDNIIEQIVSLLSAVDEIRKYSEFEYVIGNIETSGNFLSKNKDCLYPSNQMIMKSTLIFVTEFKLKRMSINLHHMIFKKGKTVCLFNPTSGILYTSASESYNIITESFN
jgi:hypothetical protein